MIKTVNFITKYLFAVCLISIFAFVLLGIANPNKAQAVNCVDNYGYSTPCNTTNPNISNPTTTPNSTTVNPSTPTTPEVLGTETETNKKDSTGTDTTTKNDNTKEAGASWFQWWYLLILLGLAALIYWIIFTTRGGKEPK